MALDPKMSVLVVDDYSTMVRIIRNLLRQIGFEDIDDAADGSSALEENKVGDTEMGDLAATVGKFRDDVVIAPPAPKK